MILMPQIFNLLANENVHYKGYELEFDLSVGVLSIVITS